MAIEAGMAAQQARTFQPLPRQDSRRPIADFTSKSRPAAMDSLALPKMEPARTREAVLSPRPLPPAPAFPRRVERETPIPAAARAAANAPAERAAVPVKLNALMQEARGREAVTAMAKTGGIPAGTPAPRIAPVRASVERAPVAVQRAVEPTATPVHARPRFQAMSVVAQEITQLNARQAIQNTLRDRSVAENAGTGRVRAARTLIDQRV